MGGFIEDTVGCYKVVRDDLKSLGIGHKKKTDIPRPTIQYKLKEWVAEPNPIAGECWEGGLWSFRQLSDARSTRKYMITHPDPDIRNDALIFEVVARGILYERKRRDGRPYRIKSREVFLEEIVL
jgi:hypothetical protein